MEIISADSVQVFKGFDIGSAKIKKEEMQGVKHHGIDIISPNEMSSVADFVQYTKNKIKEIKSKGKIPVIVGGTGLYVKSLIEGYTFGGTERHDDFRQEMENIAEKDGLSALFRILEEKNPHEAKKIDKHNKVRIIRALEIATFGNEKSTTSVEYDFLTIALTMPREKLYENINNRSKIMLEAGLIEETKKLYEKYGDCQPMGAIGYKETLSYLKGEISKSELLEKISQHTRNYAKRQLTFMRGLSYIKYFDKTDENSLEKIYSEIDKWIEEKN